MLSDLTSFLESLVTSMTTGVAVVYHGPLEDVTLLKYAV
jgi:hypothetical protein